MEPLNLADGGTRQSADDWTRRIMYKDRLGLPLKLHLETSRVNLCGPTQSQHAPHEVCQLPHISRPQLQLEQVQKTGVETCGRRLHLRCVLAGEVLCQDWNILAAIS
jgi:hypothetical protein